MGPGSAPKRSHDAEMIKKVETYLKDHDTSGLDIRIMAPVEAMKFTLERTQIGRASCRERV